MRVDTRPRRKNAPRIAEKSAPQFLQWLRGRGCMVGNADCMGKIEAAHVDYAGGKGISTKVADRYAVPLCSHHHRLQHSIGWRRFEASLLSAGEALLATGQYWKNWPGRIAWERKLEAGQ